MSRFRVIHLEVEAFQWLGAATDMEKFRQFLTTEDGMTSYRSYFLTKDMRNIYIRTLEGDMRAEPGDWIIKGIENEFYPCNNRIFEKKYEPVLVDVSN